MPSRTCASSSMQATKGARREAPRRAASARRRPARALPDRRQRHCDAEGGAFARRERSCDAMAEHARDAVDDREAQAEAALAVASPRWRRRVNSWNTGLPDGPARCRGRCRRRRSAAIRRCGGSRAARAPPARSVAVADRVGEKVLQHAPQQRRIALGRPAVVGTRRSSTPCCSAIGAKEVGQRFQQRPDAARRAAPASPRRHRAWRCRAARRAALRPRRGRDRPWPPARRRGWRSANAATNRRAACRGCSRSWLAAAMKRVLSMLASSALARGGFQLGGALRRTRCSSDSFSVAQAASARRRSVMST